MILTVSQRHMPSILSETLVELQIRCDFYTCSVCIKILTPAVHKTIYCDHFIRYEKADGLRLKMKICFLPFRAG